MKDPVKGCCPRYEVSSSVNEVYLSQDGTYKSINNSQVYFEQKTSPPSKTLTKTFLKTGDGTLFSTAFLSEDELYDYIYYDDNGIRWNFDQMAFELIGTHVFNNQSKTYNEPGVGEVTYTNAQAAIYSISTLYDPYDPFYDEDGDLYADPVPKKQIGPKNAPETYSNKDGEFSISIPTIDPPVDPLSVSSQIVNITGKVIGLTQDFQGKEIEEGIYNATVYTSEEYGDAPSPNTIRTKTDPEGNFEMSIPKETKFISGRIKSDAINATPNSYYVDSLEFNPDKNYYVLQLKLSTEVVAVNIVGKRTLSTLPPTLIISAEGYESKEIIPYKGDGTPKKDIGDIELTPISDSVENDAITISQLDENTINNMTSSKKKADYYIMKRLFKVIKQLKSVLIPIILKLLMKFGISKAQELIGKSKEEIQEYLQNQAYCPTTDQIPDIIRKKNQLVKGLNNALKTIDATTTALGIAGGVITAMEIAFNALAIIPVPINPGVPIALNKIEKIIARLKIINVGLLALLVLLRQTIVLAIELLNLLDTSLQHCAPDTEEEQTQINAELLALVEEQKTQNNSPVITIVNGFTMDLETEITENPLKRKRAIAKNADGVSILKGEWSFSSIDQILIDELVFYIQSNNLKAD